MADRMTERSLDLPLDAYTAKDLASIILHGGIKGLSVELALRELAWRADQPVQMLGREQEIGKLAIQLFARLMNG
jgi:hypothetical protein